MKSRTPITWLILASFGVMACWMSIPQVAWAQQVTAAITGVVTDPSGAPIGNATVAAKDTQRGTAWTTQTNDAGAYNLPRVPIGIYDINRIDPTRHGDWRQDQPGFAFGQP